MNKQNIIVIGAGIAGLTAAYRLQQAGHSVHVLEARDYIGGRMASMQWEGFTINPGAQFFTGVDSYLLQMAQELGLGEQIRKRSSEGFMLAIYRDGKIHPVNFLSIGSYLRWSGVSLGARMAMLRLIPYILRYRGGNPYHMERGPGPDDLSYAEFFRRSIHSEMFDYWAYPTFETNCSYQAEDLSRKAFLSLMAGYLNANTYYFADGIGALTAAFGRMLDVQLGSPAQQVEYRSGRGPCPGEQERQTGIPYGRPAGNGGSGIARAGALLRAAPGLAGLFSRRWATPASPPSSTFSSTPLSTRAWLRRTA